MNQTTISELQQELINLEAPIMTPRTSQIDTPDFGAVSMGAAIQLSSINSPLKFSMTPTEQGFEHGSSSVVEAPPGLGKLKPVMEEASLRHLLLTLDTLDMEAILLEKIENGTPRRRSLTHDDSSP
eukprot:2669002-Amphidinium_carterae.1